MPMQTLDLVNIGNHHMPVSLHRFSLEYYLTATIITVKLYQGTVRTVLTHHIVIIMESFYFRNNNHHNTATIHGQLTDLCRKFGVATTVIKPDSVINSLLSR